MIKETNEIGSYEQNEKHPNVPIAIPAIEDIKSNLNRFISLFTLVIQQQLKWGNKEGPG